MCTYYTLVVVDCWIVGMFFVWIFLDVEVTTHKDWISWPLPIGMLLILLDIVSFCFSFLMGHSSWYSKFCISRWTVWTKPLLIFSFVFIPEAAWNIKWKLIYTHQNKLIIFSHKKLLKNNLPELMFYSFSSFHVWFFFIGGLRFANLLTRLN